MVFCIGPATNLQRRPDAAFISDAHWPFRKRVPDVPVWDMGGRAGHWLSLTPVPSQSEQGHPEAVTATADASVDVTEARNAWFFQQSRPMTEDAEQRRRG
jgi:hypothetical protein